MKTRRKIFHRDEFSVAIIDESHHSLAGTYAPVIEYFNPRYLLGMTATPDRSDLKDIRTIYGTETVNIPLSYALANNLLTSVDYYMISDNLNITVLNNLARHVLKGGERLIIRQLNESVFVRSKDMATAKKIMRHNAKTIIFCRNIKHAEHFSQYIPGSKVYHSEMSKRKRERVLADFRANRLQYILVIDVFNEGMDIPDAELIVFLRTTQSKIIFFQQLGRGLRKVPGKEKVVVLDFVGNIERVLILKQLREKIERQRKGGKTPRGMLNLSGEGFKYISTEHEVLLIQILERIEAGFYPTWQEAGEAAQKLGIKTIGEYKKRYKEDPKLPSIPNRTYPDFPGFTVFLGGEKKEFYPTWQEAGEAAQKLGIETKEKYSERYKEDPKLPSIPNRTYPDFPGFTVFLGGEKKEFYLTWQEASEAAQKLGIKSRLEYLKRYKENPKLPYEPHMTYPDFPGFTVFLGGEKKEFYLTWQEASEAAQKLGIKTTTEYKKRYKENSKLPSNPNMFYPDFPEWKTFFGTVKNYPTWQEASEAVQNMGIKTRLEYRKRYKENSKLPVNPKKFYSDFPEWKTFFGTVKNFYPTWQEASEAVQNMGIKSELEYQKRYKEDSRLPGAPRVIYPDFPGFTVFLGGEKKEFYPTWQEAGEAAQKLGIKNRLEYLKRYKENPKLPYDPNTFYPDFPRFKIFLGKQNPRSK